MGCFLGKEQHKTTQQMKQTKTIKEQQQVAKKYLQSELPLQSKDDPHRICSLTHISNDDHINPSSVPVQSHSHKQLCMGTIFTTSRAATQPTFTKTTRTQIPHSAHPSNHDLILKNNQHPVSLEYVLARKNFVESQNIPLDQRLSMFPAPRLKSIDRSTLIFRRKIESYGE